MPVVLLSLIIIFLLYVGSTMCRRNHKGLKNLRGWAYAHRGLHGKGVPENSLTAFRLALEAGYGSELDVHLLSDGELAVIHDSSLKRTTGLDGKIEDLVSAQLSEIHLEDTDETIPLFSQVLELYSGKAPLIVELKPVCNNTARLCTKVCEFLDRYEGAFCVESFDPRCVRWFTENRPEYIRGQLSENFLKSPNSNLPFIIKFIMKAQICNFLTRPDFVAYKYADRKNLSNFLCRRLWGAQGVTWTIKSIDEYRVAVNEGWIPIFEDFTP